MRWILADPKPNLLTRFGTLQLASTSPEEKNSFRIGILHEALDITRSQVSLSDKIYAPASGLAKVIYDGNEDGSDSDPYSTALCIREESSQAVICMLHLLVLPEFKEKSKQGGFQVKQGDVVGHLTPVEPMAETYRDLYSHSHVSVIDIPGDRYINPATYFSAYQDHIAPQAKVAYFLDEHSKLLKSLPSGKIDLVLEVFDQDDNRDRNFEISKISFRLEDDKSRTLLEVQDCSTDAFSAPFPKKSIDSNLLYDLGHALPAAVSREWKGSISDATVRDRTFMHICY